MQKRITLNEAAKKLGLFYTELMDVLDVVIIEYPNSMSDISDFESLDDLDRSPDTLLDYDAFLQIQKHLKITILPDKDPAMGKLYDPSIYPRDVMYSDRLGEWCRRWQLENKPIYDELYNAYEGYLKHRGLIIPTSSEDMFLWLLKYYVNQEGRRPEYYLAKSFTEEYFYQYHDFKKKKLKPDTSIKETLKNDHWALYYTYLIEKKIVVGNDNIKTCVAFFESIGMKGKDIYNKHVLIKNDKKRREYIRLQGIPFMNIVKKMLTKEGYKTAVKLLMEDSEAVFGNP